MRRPFHAALGLVPSLCALSTFSCDRAPSCKRLEAQMRKCGADRAERLSGEAFVGLCERRRGRPATRARIACSKETDCKAFLACVGKVRAEERRAQLERRWAEVSRAAAAGDLTKAFTFCEVRGDELTDDMKKRCEALPGEVVATLSRELTALRDRGEIPEKSTRCWELKRAAARAGTEARRRAEDLCEELEVARRLAATRAEVKKALAAARPFLTYGCHPLRLAELVRKVRSPYTRKAQAELVDLCLRKLGKVILERRVPTQTRCEVRDLYRAIRQFEVKDPALDPWMERARKACEP